MVWRGTELADLQEEERATSPPATNNRKGSQRVQSIMMERLRRRGLHGTSIHYRLQRLHSLVLLLRNSSAVESNVSLQCTIGRLFFTDYCR